MRWLAFFCIWVQPMVSVTWSQEGMVPVPLKSKVTQVQPMTGIVLWSTNPKTDSSPIQLEYSYLRYDQVVTDRGVYDWTVVDSLLQEVASRKHQVILRWHDTYVGKPTGVPAYIKALGDYRETHAKSENKPTSFPDWSHPEWKALLLEFMSEFAERYDRDPRIAFVQVGFGLWSEYHIYDGPMELGKTFPTIEYQADFAKHLASQFLETPWMISVDAAGDHTPFSDQVEIQGLRFGLFDDSFNHAKHREENEPNWDVMGRERWKVSPTGGEFSFFESVDQKKALSPKGPHGIPFEAQAGKFHISFMIGDDQPRFQSSDRIREASLATGYRFRILRFLASSKRSEVTVENIGIAPIYYDAYVAVNGVRSGVSLKGFLPGQSIQCDIESGGENPIVTIESERLVPGQRIEFDADLGEGK